LSYARLQNPTVRALEDRLTTLNFMGEVEVQRGPQPELRAVLTTPGGPVEL
ncbi:VOC family protein, partial [Deinococcus sp. 14RED07]|nr:VOC family protein [Deinococcus sp. 14RED07]